jgi:hypothetical protein
MLRRSRNANGKKGIVIPAQAGIHLATNSTADRWTPACAGVTI